MHRALALAAALLAIIPAPAGAGTIASAERLIRQCANRERLRVGLAPLARSGALDAAAQSFADEMAARRFFDHVDPDGNGPQERVDAVESGWLVGENIAMGYRSVSAACRGWMTSPGHRENILDTSYEAIGTGYARGHGGPLFVQDFALREDSSQLDPDAERTARARGHFAMPSHAAFGFTSILQG